MAIEFTENELGCKTGSYETETAFIEVTFDNHPVDGTQYVRLTKTGKADGLPEPLILKTSDFLEIAKGIEKCSQ